MPTIYDFKEKLQALVSKFNKDKHHYLSKGYPETQVRIDFLDPHLRIRKSMIMSDTIK